MVTKVAASRPAKIPRVREAATDCCSAGALAGLRSALSQQRTPINIIERPRVLRISTRKRSVHGTQWKPSAYSWTRKSSPKTKISAPRRMVVFAISTLEDPFFAEALCDQREGYARKKQEERRGKRSTELRPDKECGVSCFRTEPRVVAMRLKHQDAGQATHPVDVGEALHRSRPLHGKIISRKRVKFGMGLGSIWDAMGLRYNLLFLLKVEQAICQRRANSVCFLCSACGPGCALRERFTPPGTAMAAVSSRPR